MREEILQTRRIQQYVMYTYVASRGEWGYESMKINPHVHVFSNSSSVVAELVTVTFEIIPAKYLNYVIQLSAYRTSR